ncbi:MAG: amidohydrolase family protein, partial [Acidimicrobiia bacterium]|nr:amidohydrolase family protein [Acidimicrobiia bacterium]
LCDVVAAGAVTLGRRGERLAPLGELAALGVRLFSDEGAGVTDPRLLRRALEYASDLGIVLAQPAEDARLGAGGYAHEGGWSSRLGLAAVAAEAEEIAVMRDLALVRQVGARLHFRRLSTAASLAMVRAARRAGLAVSADATLHHALLNDGALGGRLPPFAGWVAPAGLRPDEPDPARAYDPQFLFRPPLRPEADRAAVLACLEAADVDALVSDHTPVPAHLKEMPLDGAAAGAVGLETTPILAFSHLGVPLARLIPLLSWQPAALAGLGAAHGGELAAGRPANLVVIEPGAAGQIDPARFASRSRNTPWAGVHTTFAVRHTIARGRAVVIEGEAQC